jgi:hypothetical protein
MLRRNKVNIYAPCTKDGTHFFLAECFSGSADGMLEVHVLCFFFQKVLTPVESNKLGEPWLWAF